MYDKEQNKQKTKKKRKDLISFEFTLFVFPAHNSHFVDYVRLRSKGFNQFEISFVCFAIRKVFS